MLRPEEIATGGFAETDDLRLTLMLPRHGSDEMILITNASGEKVAIYLGQHKYSACQCGDSNGWKGLLVAGVSIELDERSLFDPGSEDAPPGAVVRAANSLSVIAKMVDSHHINRLQPVALLNDLPLCHELTSAGFRKWQIVYGEGEDRRVLASVDVTPSKQT